MGDRVHASVCRISRIITRVKECRPPENWVFGTLNLLLEVCISTRHLKNHVYKVYGCGEAAAVHQIKRPVVAAAG